ncbi:TetR/AcrR family transcriptional regulator [Streptomyces sp. SID3343]|uniref:TetR/AcrR family transcriptional regulator n=1 Tax=Streptomyces sp. SID3343 TaxID=2690260 RepID=UPI00136DC2FE|nr:TetR/AcrR family transcriptional regulator [Streptomyces sp. SID3343]MYW05516.1 TetR family transcriptional regulator [Streptomyces sp. SID3343]
MGRRPDPERKTELLRAIVDELARGGLGDMSLRPLAAALGVSTYTLSYQFGSKESLLAQALAHVEAEQAALVREWAEEEGADAAFVVGRYWEWVRVPEHLARVRLTLEAIAMPRTFEWLAPDFRRRLMAAWAQELTAGLRRAGVARPRAEAEATLAASALAGMVLDLLATGEQARLDSAARALVERLDELIARGR